MNAYFYITINKINNKFYYGSGSKYNYIGSGKILTRAIKKYGIENFELIILKEFVNRTDAYKFEDRFLKLYKISSLKESYNIKDSALGGDTFANLSDDHKERLCKIKSYNTTKNNLFRWSTMSDDDRKIIGKKIALAKSKHNKERKSEIYRKFINTINNRTYERQLEINAKISESKIKYYESLSDKEKTIIAMKTVETRKANLEHLSKDERSKILKKRHGSFRNKSWYHKITDDGIIERAYKFNPGSPWVKGRSFKMDKRYIYTVYQYDMNFNLINVYENLYMVYRNGFAVPSRMDTIINKSGKHKGFIFTKKEYI